MFWIFRELLQNDWSFKTISSLFTIGIVQPTSGVRMSPGLQKRDDRDCADG